MGISGSSRPTSVAEEAVTVAVCGGAGGKPLATAGKRERGVRMDVRDCAGVRRERTGSTKLRWRFSKRVVVSGRSIDLTQLYYAIVSKCRILLDAYLPTPWLSSRHLQTVFLVSS